MIHFFRADTRRNHCLLAGDCFFLGNICSQCIAITNPQEKWIIKSLAKVGRKVEGRLVLHAVAPWLNCSTLLLLKCVYLKWLEGTLAVNTKFKVELFLKSCWSPYLCCFKCSLVTFTLFSYNFTLCPYNF